MSSRKAPTSSSRKAPLYDPVGDFLQQRGTHAKNPSAAERKLLETLNKREVDALVSILCKAQPLATASVDAPVHGAVSF